MRATTAELSQNEERLKEYQRQQERLKALTSNADKVKAVSADMMIENLLKQNFVKTNNANSSRRVSSGPVLPNWLYCESSEVPGAYKHLWTLVKTQTNLADTQKVSQLLLTSGLPAEVLGFIWNLSNKAVPGQLNKQEFYIVLALVALAQSGCSFNNLSVLNLVTNAPIPVLQSKVLEEFLKSPATSSESYLSHINSNVSSDEDAFSLSQLSTSNVKQCSSFNSIATSVASVGSEEKKLFQNLSKNNPKSALEIENSWDFSRATHFPCIGSSPTAGLEDEDDFSEFQSVFTSGSPVETSKKIEISSVLSSSDEFTDFQCAEIVSDSLETVVISQKKEIPKIPLPKNFSGKLSNLRTNTLKISPESEKKLKVLTQSETLSTLPESKISTNNKVSTMTNISVLAGSRDVGMRLANHCLVSGSVTDKSRNQRQKHKQTAVNDDLECSSQFTSLDDLFPKCFQRTSSGSKTFILKETKIGKSEAKESELCMKNELDTVSDNFSSGRNTRKIEIPMLGTFNETTLPAQTATFQSIQSTVELFSVEEDKYSALREVELEMKMRNNEKDECDESINHSDGTDDFGEFLSAEIPSSLEKNNDLWGDWINHDETSHNTSEKSIDSFNSIKTEEGSNKIDNNKAGDLTNIMNFDLLNLTDTTIPALPEFDQNLRGNQNNNFEDQMREKNKICLEHESVYELMMKDNLKNDEPNHHATFDNVEANFDMFFMNEFTPAEANRDVCLLNLNLEKNHRENTEQECVRKKCLSACIHLIQQGLDIFNGVTSTIILEEVLSTQEAVDYLNNLNAVYQISRRIGANYEKGLPKQDVIESMWQKLAKLCLDHHITLKEDIDNASLGIQCHLCYGFIRSGVIENGFSSYHPSCANLWVNCIDSQLP